MTRLQLIIALSLAYIVAVGLLWAGGAMHGAHLG